MNTMLQFGVVVLMLVGQVISQGCLEDSKECSSNANCCDGCCLDQRCATSDHCERLSNPPETCDDLDCEDGEMCYMETLNCHRPPCTILEPHCDVEGHIHDCGDVSCHDGQICHEPDETDDLPSCRVPE